MLGCIEGGVGETQVVYLGLLTGLNNGGLKMVE